MSLICLAARVKKQRKKEEHLSKMLVPVGVNLRMTKISTY